MHRPRIITFGFFAALVAAFFFYAFWPRAILVDLAMAEQGHMMLTIDEEAKARVREVYVVSTPIAGRLMRVDVEPGDMVTAGDSVVARMRPTNPIALDVRTEEQAAAAVEAAEAALEVARADAARADADLALARSSRDRSRRLVEAKAAPQAEFDQADRNYKAALAVRRSAVDAINMRAADVASARAMLMDVSDMDNGNGPANRYPSQSIPVTAPISGVILRVVHESETTLPVGADVLHIGDPDADLEIVAELLSPKAVEVSPGDRVIIERWGGRRPLDGVVNTVEPWAFTKISALGIEEQRANVIIRLTEPDEAHKGLGHGYRVYVRIVTWERDDAVTVPTNTLFRHGEGMAVFRVVGNRARLTPVEIGHNNGQVAEVLSGVDAGDTIILYPADNVTDRVRVRDRSGEANGA